MIDYTRLISQYVYNLTKLPEEVIECTKKFIADYYASCIAGYKVNKVFNDAVQHLICEKGGIGEVNPFFTELQLPIEEAAYMDAVFAHGADMDDGNRKSMGHIAASVMSAVFNLAETLNCTWEDVFIAVNVGYDVFNRLAASVQPGLAHRGFHSTGMAGGIACAAACSKLMKLNEDEIYNAIGIAGIQSSGLFIITESGQTLKPLNPANAAKIGIISAKLAANGIEGPENPLENPKKGWFHAMSDSFNGEMITEGLGKVFTITESYLKPYPSCRHTHCGIDAALAIRKRIMEETDGINESDIESVNISIYSNAILVAGQVIEPKNQDESKFSIHYATAIALLAGHFTLDDLEISNLTSNVKSLIQKISFTIDPKMENVSEGIRGAKVTVNLINKTSYTETVMIPSGDAAKPFTWKDIENKFMACSENVLPICKAHRIFNAILEIKISEKYKKIRLGI